MTTTAYAFESVEALLLLDRLELLLTSSISAHPTSILNVSLEKSSETTALSYVEIPAIMIRARHLVPLPFCYGLLVISGRCSCKLLYEAQAQAKAFGAKLCDQPNS